MKERPILFSAPMVRAILEGRKTQTRLVVKPQPKHRLVEGLAHVTIGMRPEEDGQVWYDADGINAGREVRCPYGRIGDRMWVKQSACYWTYPNGRVGGLEPIVYNDDDEWSGVRKDSLISRPKELEEHVGWWKFRPSIHMPRWASRITLEVVNVRVERLQQIGEQDAKAEGVESVAEYAALWDSINKGHKWHTHPWVWVVDFKVVKP